jgi:aldose 1-epimerase
MHAEKNVPPKRGVAKPDQMGSRILAALVLTCLVVALFLGYRSGIRGSLHKLTHPGSAPSEAIAPRPGGQAAVNLTRLPTQNGLIPEFISTTVLPGLGSQILQITAAFPGKGEISLLKASTLAEMAEGADGSIGETAVSAAKDGSREQTGAAVLAYLANGDHRVAQASDAVTLQPADSSENHATPDGANMTILFHAASQGLAGGLPAGIELRSSIVMSGRSLDMSLTARNSGKIALPLRVGWFPHLAIPSGQREQARLIIPSADRNSGSGNEDFSVPGGRLLNGSNIDATFTHLRRAFLGNGPEIELEDPASGYALRITAISSSIRSLQVIAPAHEAWVVLAPIAQPEVDLAEGEHAGGGSPLLAPGESLQFRIRLQIVPLTIPTK